MSSFEDFYQASMTTSSDPAAVDNARATFEERHGKLLHYSFFSAIRAGVGLTEKSELVFVDPPFPGREDIELLILKAKNLYRDARDMLEAVDCRRCLEAVYFVISGLLGVQDSTANITDDQEKKSRLDAAARIHQEELSWVEANFKLSAGRTMQSRYIEGTLIGLAPLVIGGVVLFRSVSFVFESKAISLEILGAWVAGGLGAILSVMTRLSSGRLTLDYTASSITTRLLGGMRPMIGASMGVVLLTFIKSGWIPLAIPSGADAGEKAAFFLLAVTFIAGFSERLVQDMLTAADNDPRFASGVAGRLPTQDPASTLPPTSTTTSSSTTSARPATSTTTASPTTSAGPATSSTTSFPTTSTTTAARGPNG